MNKEEIKKSEIYNAASVALANGFMRAYDVSAMGHYMFLQGYMFAKTGKMPTSDLEKITDNTKKDISYSMEEIIYFEINNWCAGIDYPNDEIFYKWIKDCQFMDDEYCKQNKLCVMCGAIDMSMNYCVAAPKSWVEKNCPKLLTDEEYEYKIITSGLDKETGKVKETLETYKKKYSDFLCHPETDGDVYGHISDWCFPEYCEENFGVTLNNSWWEDEDDKD